MDNSIWENLINNGNAFIKKFSNGGREFWSKYSPILFDPVSYAKKAIPEYFNINTTSVSQPSYNTSRGNGYITDGTRRIEINNGKVSANYPMSSTGFSSGTTVNVPVADTNVDNTPVHNFTPGEDVSKYYRYNPKTTQASREAYQQYVDAVNAWDRQKATPEQQYVNNFINSYDQYQKIRNGWR